MDAIKVNEIVNKYGKGKRLQAVAGTSALTGPQEAGFKAALAARTDIKTGRSAAIAATVTATA